ncbi:radical SAM protein [Candidatus Bipolaricaulota bacterium]|nr:radical SAM protein [Candidatus Bipolaricaulota bacterium]
MERNQKTELAFETSIFDTLRLAARIFFHDPRFAVRALRMLSRQRKAAKVRQEHSARGQHVPPFSIFSITGKCNLSCAGCYANLLHRSDRPELSNERIKALLSEARDLGVSIMLIAGGEPLLREGLLELTKEVPEILFLLFTNATLLDASVVSKLREQPHVVPILSLEGDKAFTDARRGAGSYEGVIDAMRRLKEQHVFFGTSTTLTSENFELTTSRQHLRDLLKCGCRLFYYINYIPVESGTEHLQLPGGQVQEFETLLARYRKTLPCLFIAFPHDEIALGGCLAAGRGFVHINAYGDVEPCPFSPYSDRNLNHVSLLDAINSPLLRAIRESGVELDETDGHCALWTRKEWVQGLLAQSEQGGEVH